MSAQNKLWAAEHIRKQLSAKKTYKELQPMLKEVASDNKSVVTAALEAIRTILTSQEATPNEKLLAARLSKDCFERGSLTYIEGFLHQLLPVYVQLAETLQPKCTQKQLEELTATLQLHADQNVNLYVLLVESLRNWSQWTKNLPNSRELAEVQLHETQAFASCEKKRMKGLTISKFYSERSAKWFDERLRELPPTVFESTFKGIKKPKPQAPSVPSPPPSSIDKKSGIAPIESVLKDEIEDIFLALRTVVNRSREQLGSIINSASEELDKAVDKYCTNSANFDENYVNNCYERFEAQKRKLLSQQPKRQPAVAAKPVAAAQHQKQMFEQLPERMDFHNDSESEESSEMHETKAGKSKPSRNLGIIVEEPDIQSPEISANLKHLQQLMKQKQQLAEENAAIQRKLKEMKNHPTLEIENNLTKELMDVKRNKFLLVQEVEAMQRKVASLSMQAFVISRQQPLQSIDEPKEVAKLKAPDTPVAEFGGSGLAPSPQSIVDKSTHILTRMLRCLMSAENIGRFKLAVLGTSRELYRGGSITVTLDSRLQAKLDCDLLNIHLELLLPRHADLSLKYRNSSAETDLWTKPLVRASVDKPYQQQLTVKMVKPPELITICKATSNSLSPFQFALPVLFINFLRNGQVVQSAFRAAFNLNKASVVSSNNLVKNHELLQGPNDVSKYFDNAFLTKQETVTVSNMAFLLPSQNRIFLVRMLFPSEKMSIEVLEIEGQGHQRYSAQLLSDLAFLFAA